MLKLSNTSDGEEDVLVHDPFSVVLHVLTVRIYVARLLLHLLDHVLLTLLRVEAHALAKRYPRCLARAVARERTRVAAVVLGVKLIHRFTMLGDCMDRLAMDPLAHVVDIDHAVLESFCAS